MENRSIDNSERTSRLYVTAVERAMQLLSAFDHQHTRLTLSQLVKLTGLNMSAVQRFAYTLLQLGYLDRDESSKTYRPAVKLLNFAFQYTVSNEMLSRAAPILKELACETDETANITVLDGTDIVFALRIISQHVLNFNVITGTRLPAYCTAPGLAMMAHLRESHVDTILAKSDLVAHTAKTVTDASQIKERLVQIREAGYCLSIDEYFVGDISIAAAILDARSQPIGAVNVAIAKSRWNGKEDQDRIANLVLSAAAAINSNMWA